MKRILTLLMAAVMVIGGAGLASAAVEFKASGHMHLNFSVIDNMDFDKDAAEDNFFAAQRFRPRLTMAADGVTAVFEAQQQQAMWGSDWPVGGNPNVSVRIRQAYIDFKLPSTPVSLKVGYQQLSLPSIWGHPVFDARVGAVVANIPFSSEVALTAFWARPADKISSTITYNDDIADPDSTSDIDVTADQRHNSTDMFGVMLPLNFGNVKATPYLVYAKVGQVGIIVDNTVAAPYPATGYSWNDTLIIGGAHVAIMPIDALSIKVDAIVTNHKSDGPSGLDGEAKTGFMLAAAVDYELPWGTPGVFAWYATGDDDKGEGAFRTIATDGFGPSSWAFAGGNTFAYDSQISDTGISTAAIGVQIADLSFVDSLKHTARVLYGMGTADEESEIYPTTEDSFIELNFDSNWSIYENLAAVVELGAIFPDFDGEGDTSLKAQLTLRFTF